jgi:hypothetical protein
MAVKFEQKKTTELSDEEFTQIVALFQTVFERETSVDSLRHSYMSTPLGYSYHSIMKDEGVICGFNSFEPSYFLYHGKKYLFASSVTTMVDVMHRGATNFYYIVSKAYPYLKNEGVSLVYAYPNNNSYPVFTKMKLTKDVGEMFTYFLPLRIGSVKPSLSSLNWFSQFICRGFVWISGVFASDKNVSFPVKKDIETYDGPRYSKNLHNVYRSVDFGNAIFHYRVKVHEGVRTAFFIDINPKSSKSFVKAVKYLIKNEGKGIDMILYPGYLPFSVTGMIKLPMKYAPKRLSLTAKVLDETIFGDDIWDIKNWDTNLSNYDLI